MKRGNAGASLRESINRTRKFFYDARNPVRWNEGEREALIQQAIERGMVTKVPPQSAFIGVSPYANGLFFAHVQHTPRILEG